jgi:CheY-like chemotaxis protein
MFPMGERTNERLKVLLLSSPASECAILLQEALGQEVELVTATSMAECLRRLKISGRPAASAVHRNRAVSSQPEPVQSNGFDAILCDWCFQGGTWRNALELIHSRAPHLPVIVVCRTGDEAEWTQVLAAGGFDMITAPFSTVDILSVLTHAASSRTEPELLQTA